METIHRVSPPTCIRRRYALMPAVSSGFNGFTAPVILLIALNALLAPAVWFGLTDPRGEALSPEEVVLRCAGSQAT